MRKETAASNNFLLTCRQTQKNAQVHSLVYSRTLYKITMKHLLLSSEISENCTTYPVVSEKI